MKGGKAIGVEIDKGSLTAAVGVVEAAFKIAGAEVGGDSVAAEAEAEDTTTTAVAATVAAIERVDGTNRELSLPVGMGE